MIYFGLEINIIQEENSIEVPAHKYVVAIMTQRGSRGVKAGNHNRLKCFVDKWMRTRYELHELFRCKSTSQVSTIHTLLHTV
jgi:hypothetical protein